MINLLPLPQKEHLYKERKKRIVTMALFLFFFVECISIVLLFAPYLSLTFRQKVTKNELLQSQESLARTGEENNFDDVIALTNNRLSYFFDADKEPAHETDLISRLMNVRTNGVAVTNMLFSHSASLGAQGAPYSVSLQGIALDRESLQNFVDAVKQVDGASNVVLPISNFTPDSNIPFTIMLSMM